MVESDIDAAFSRQGIKIIAALLQQPIFNQTLNCIEHSTASIRIITPGFEQFVQKSSVSLLKEPNIAKILAANTSI